MSKKEREDTCPKCGVDLKPGLAIQNSYVGSPEWPGSEIMTVSYGGPGKLVSCLKCYKCGFSTTYGTQNERD